MNLTELFGMLQARYSRRNRIHLTRPHAFSLLLDGKAALDKHIRKGASKEVIGDALASMVARLWAYTFTYGDDVPIALELTRKYPSYGCAYCTKKPCGCGFGSRPDITLAIPDPDQVNWSITRTCANSAEVYGAVNAERGIDKALLRLWEEIIELHRVDSFDSFDRRTTNTRLLESVAHESVDVLAWILNIAVMLDIPIERHLFDRYNGPCQRCQFASCECTSTFLLEKRARSHGGADRSADTVTVGTETC